MGLQDIHQAAWEMRISKEYQKFVRIIDESDDNLTDCSVQNAITARKNL